MCFVEADVQHSMRFFAANPGDGDRTGNLPAGLVVDTKVGVPLAGLPQSLTCRSRTRMLSTSTCRRTPAFRERPSQLTSEFEPSLEWIRLTAVSLSRTKSA